MYALCSCNHVRFDLIFPNFTIRNAEDQVVLKIKGPFFTCSCGQNVEFQVFAPDGETEVGKISKQWSGLFKEYFTDADNFGIQCELARAIHALVLMCRALHAPVHYSISPPFLPSLPPPPSPLSLLSVPMDLDVKMKAVMIGATFLIVSSILHSLFTSLILCLPQSVATALTDRELCAQPSQKDSCVHTALTDRELCAQPSQTESCVHSPHRQRAVCTALTDRELCAQPSQTESCVQNGIGNGTCFLDDGVTNVWAKCFCLYVTQH